MLCSGALVLRADFSGQLLPNTEEGASSHSQVKRYATHTFITDTSIVALGFGKRLWCGSARHGSLHQCRLRETGAAEEVSLLEVVRFGFGAGGLSDHQARVHHLEDGLLDARDFCFVRSHSRRRAF